MVTHIDDIVQDIVDAQGKPASLQERNGLDHLRLLIQIHEKERVDRGQVAEPQIVAAGQAGTIGGCAALIASLQPQTEALVENAARQFDLVPRRAAVAADR